MFVNKVRRWLRKYVGLCFEVFLFWIDDLSEINLLKRMKIMGFG